MATSDAAAEAILVLTTTADDESAVALSRTLVEEGLAACVTRTPVRSVFRWEATASGEPGRSPRDMRVCDEAEVLLLIKTARARLAELERRILELHSYDCPEILVIAPEHAGAKYLAWLLAACG